MRLVRWLIFFLSIFLVFQFISLYLSWQKQAVLGAVLVVIAIVMNRISTSKIVTISLMLMSMAATLRYGWWRIGQLLDYFSDEANNPFKIDSILMLILLSAEVYTILIMVLGYAQTVWPLQRRPVALPADEDKWPHVDMLIPTYNEPLSLVRYTALAALNIDYPPEKLHVYILDDGVRDEYRDFCEEAGIGYKIREKHTHAKAGNINTALETMDSPLVSIFDCDHVPTRSFLQMTVGWFLADENLAMLQTPHHFYSADPFERNLKQYRTIPNEGELFYGIIQDGNDLWNATFFCGSCAVIRRTALDEVGGIATETVTEDAHTSLRLQKLGYNTAYINIAMAAGLATETLAAHVGQRIRWARGMIQILRTDNPLLAKGMKLTQRFCYFNAMAHFLYAIPRLVFLLAPLMYMVFSRTIIPGYWVAILAYAMPHLIISSLTNSRVQGTHRHSFWNEIYETVLAPYILMPTTLALLNPKLGKFNVTDKGSTLAETRFDRSIAAPTSWLLLLNVIGLALAPYRFLVSDPTHPGTVISNAVWICFNIIILGVAAACAHEQKQRRTAVRVEAHIALRMRLPNGMDVAGSTTDMSVGGASLQLDSEILPVKGDIVEMSFPLQTKARVVKAKVLAVLPNEIRVAFHHPTVVEQETLSRVLYSRADSWVSMEREVEVDRPLVSLWRVTRLSMTGLYQVTRGLFQSAPKPKASAILILSLCLSGVLKGQTFTPPNVGSDGGAQNQTFRPPSIGNEPDPAPARRAPAQAPVRRAPAPAPAAPRREAARPAPTRTLAAPVVTAPTPAPVQQQAVQAPVAPSPLVPPSTPNGESAPLAGLTSTGIKPVKVTLKDMGVDGAIELHGPHSYYSEGFTLPYTLVARKVTLKLSYKFARSVVPRPGTLRVSLNNTQTADIPAPTNGEGFSYAEIDLPGDALIRSNGITFEFTSNGVFQSEAQAKMQVQGWIGSSSYIEVSGDRLPFRNDIGLLPMPFLDRDMQTTTTIPFVFMSQPGLKGLQAAGVVASWFGTQVGPKPIRYTASIGNITDGNVILFADSPQKLPENLRQVQAEPGPYVAIKTNPYDPSSNVLVIVGNDEDQMLAAAQALGMRTGAPTTKVTDPGGAEGDILRVNGGDLPAQRGIDDAPSWMPTNKLVSLADYSSKDQLVTDGSHPVPIYFHVPPDLFYGEQQNLRMLVSYKYNASTTAPGSALRTYVNGTLVNEAPLAPGSGTLTRQRQIVVPVASMRPFGNTLLFAFDFIPTKTGAHTEGEILPNSAINIRGLAHYADLPDLELFANAAFPFTRRADLSETTVIVPGSPTSNEIALYLHMMSHAGAQTRYPALRIQVAGPDAVLGKDRDYIILGSVDSQPAFNSLENSLPVTLGTEGVHIRQGVGLLAQIKENFLKLVGRFTTRAIPTNDDGRADAMIEGIESPVSPGRSIVVIALREDTAANVFNDVFTDRSQSSDIGSSVSVLKHGKFRSYGMNNRVYHVGLISNYTLMRIWMAQYFPTLLIAVIAFSLIIAAWIKQYLAEKAMQRLAPGMKRLV